MAQHDPACEECTGHAVARIAKSEQVVWKIPMRADRGQAVVGERVIGRPAVLGLHAGDIWIQSRELVHQLTGALDDDLVALSRRSGRRIGAVDENAILADPPDYVRRIARVANDGIALSELPADLRRQRRRERKKCGSEPEMPRERSV